MYESRDEGVSRIPDASLEELLAFERLLFDLSARFASVTGDQIVAEIESALKQLIKFLGFDRGAFLEFDGDKQYFLCAAAVEGAEPFLPGPMPSYMNWFVKELRLGRTIVVRSYEEFPPEAIAAAEYYRRVGIHSQLVIPLTVGGRIVSAIGFGAFHPTREWPDQFIARVRLIGEVMAQALARKRTQDELQAMQFELARVTSLTAVGQMAASIAHEIKQPLAVIVTAGSAGLRWLSKPTPDRLAEVRDLLGMIVSNGDRANQVIDGIRAMFKNESREKALLDINEMIREVLALLQPEFQTRKILVQAELAPKLPPVLADRVQLQQVVVNLITNATEAMDTIDDRARKLRVNSVLYEPSGVLITVEDSGPGIDPENVDRIFHPFFTTKSRGMGMGLSICKSIIENHNGSLSTRSATGRGSVFEMVLPTGDVVGAE